MSTQVCKLDDFISHDWHTGRWAKFFTLCVVYNGTAAVTCSVLAGAAFVALAAALPSAWTAKLVLCDIKYHSQVAGHAVSRPARFMCGFVICPITFTLVLLFWQHVRSAVLRSPRLAFVDKLCISQTDEELKKEGIRSLAGFIRRSDRLVVLWSPVYFTRVWCVYEIASWLHFHGHLRSSLHFVPVKMAVGTLLATGVVFLYWAFIRIYLVFRLHVPVPWILGHFLSMVCGQLPLVSALRTQIRSLQQLPSQLGSFSIQAAKCFCCSHDHLHPDTGLQMCCDRALVYSTLENWHQRSKVAVVEPDTSPKHLTSFNSYVRTTFKKQVLKDAGTVGISYLNALLASAPTAWFAFDRCMDLPLAVVLRAAAMSACYFFCVFPSFWQFTVKGVQLSSSLWKGTAHPAFDIATTLGVVVLQCAFLVLAMPLDYTAKSENPIAQVCVTLIHAVITLLLYAPRRGGKCRK